MLWGSFLASAAMGLGAAALFIWLLEHIDDD
jgi:hypothetical protein